MGGGGGGGGNGQVLFPTDTGCEVMLFHCQTTSAGLYSLQTLAVK